jgi:hypothetical protein
MNLAWGYQHLFYVQGINSFRNFAQQRAEAHIGHLTK